MATRMLTRPAWVFCAMLVTLDPSASLFAEESQDDQEARQVLTAAVENCWAAIYRGSFRVRQRDNVIQMGRLGKVESTIYCVFDVAQDRFRFDRTLDHGIPTRDGGRILENEVMKYADTPEGSLTYTKSGNVVSKFPTGRAPFSSLFLRPFDVRMVGMAHAGELRAYGSNKAILEQLQDLLAPDNMVEAVHESDTLLRAAWVYGQQNEVRRTIWFSANQGYRPVKLQQTMEGYSTVLNRGEFEWTEVSGTWVPKKCKMIGRDERDVTTLTFEWISVNDEPDEELFQVDGFDLPENTLIGNSMLGEDRRFVEGRVGPAEVSTARNVLRTVVVALGLSAAILVVLWALYRRRRAKFGAA